MKPPALPFASMLTATAFAALNPAPPLDLRFPNYEPQTPLLPGNLSDSPNTFIDNALHGRIVPLDHLDPANVLGDASAPARAWQAAAWRNERVHAQFVVWSSVEITQLRLAASPLRAPNGAEIPASALNARFVRYVWASFARPRLHIPGRAVADILDTATELDLPASGFRPIWLTVNVPENTPPGVYRGALTVTGQGRRSVQFPLSLEVLPATLPAPNRWAFFLDLWQHPWAAARYHNVTPFSPEHYALLEPLYRELANAGQKVITTTITDRPWNQQTFDAYGSMVKRTRHANGSWSFDYTLFDTYVAFAQRCGLGPQIHCYTMVPWGNRFQYNDSATGDSVVAELKAGTPEYEAYWAPFLADFQKHLAEKGLLEQTHIALDERSPEELRASVAVLKKHAPCLKIAMAGNKSPSAYAGVTIDNYSNVISHVEDNNAAFFSEIAPRRAAGAVTTFYVCTTPTRPNTFTNSPGAESVWLGFYAAAHHFDGLLRWAYAHWPREPLWDSSFRPDTWPPGDTFLVYPGPRSSVRWELLRDGIEEFEKIRLLRQAAAAPVLTELEAALAAFTYNKAIKQTDNELAETVARARAAVESATRATNFCPSE
ncbi:MAG: DUF4091 domain-containing protein [Opitutaceae bacterium]|jgi:hypothetical protein|nr:DUF4091 domain-containing protein [Opitutaceae bacterium]